MGTFSEALARFDAMGLPWQLAILAALVLGAVAVLATGHLAVSATERVVTAWPRLSPGRR